MAGRRNTPRTPVSARTNTGRKRRTETTPTSPSTDVTPSPVRSTSRSAPLSPEARQARRSVSYEQALRIQDAKEGGEDLYDISPTPTINPPRPRTQMAGYDPQSGTLWIKFREGAVYEYYGVSPQEADRVQKGPSTGKFINSTLNYHAYARRYDLE